MARLRYTRHGPVVYEDTVKHVAYAVRAAWLEPGSAPYLASLRMDQAKTWEEFRDACSYSRIPAENMVWADRDGNIGYQAVAITPIRRNFSGRGRNKHPRTDGDWRRAGGSHYRRSDEVLEWRDSGKVGF